VTLVAEKFFGFTKVKADECEVNMAEPEKAVLDSLDKPDYCGGIPQVAYAVSSAFNSSLDSDKLLSYAGRMGSNSVLHRLGYLVELLLERGYVKVSEDFLDAIVSVKPEGASYTYLGPVGTHGRKGAVESRWKIIMNVDETMVLSELEVK
jgi:predicted transcriptional regulator of viral defense system